MLQELGKKKLNQYLSYVNNIYPIQPIIISIADYNFETIENFKKELLKGSRQIVIFQIREKILCTLD